MNYPDLAFYLWAVALTLAIAVTTKSIVHSNMPMYLLVWMAVISLVCCVFNFAAGRHVGSMYKPRKVTRTIVSPEEGRRVRKVTAGQSLGQKNTVFAIWLGYTFLAPETAIIGGLYSIWHNIYNSWQLRRERKGL
jgi:BASS family bile acid:Na+ symporter